MVKQYPSVLRPPSSVLRTWLPLALFCVLWVDLIRQLSYTWDTREQYAYGWFVPFFALYLLWRRWQDRPQPGVRSQESGVRSQESGVRSQLSTLNSQPSTAPTPPVRGSKFEVQGSMLDATSPPSSALRPLSSGSPLPSVLCLLAALCLLPLRVICEINADWPLITWAYSLIVVLLTLYAFHLAGPPSSVLRPPSSGSEPPSVLCPPSSGSEPSSVLCPPSSGSEPSSVLCPPSSGLVAPAPSSLVSPWLRHFAFPVAFILVAVCWPYRIEKGLTQNLMQVVASITTEILSVLGIPAMQKGNLIAVTTGVVGVDEACSGIRSFQSTLMAGLLMGELYRLRAWVRVGLVACGLMLAFCFNVVRTLLLSWQAAKEGISAIDKWHDPAGLTILVACFLSLWALAGWMSGKHKAESTKQKVDRGKQKTEDGKQRSEDRGQESEVSDPSPGPEPSSVLRPPSSAPGPSSVLRPPSSAPSSPVQGSTLDVQGSRLDAARPPSSVLCPPPSVLWRRYALVLGLWTLLVLGLTEVWYRFHAIKDEGVFHWSVSLPTNNPTFQAIEMSPRSVKLIASDLSATGRWQEADGSQWSTYFFRWNPTSIQSVLTSRIHRPDVCLPASGLRQIGTSELETFHAGRLQLPIRKYTYEAEGKTLHVFFCQWEDGNEQQVGLAASGQSGRLQSVWVGRRKVGQQTVEIIITGHDTLDRATQALRQRLPTLIQIETPLLTESASQDAGNARNWKRLANYQQPTTNYRLLTSFSFQVSALPPCSPLRAPCSGLASDP